MEFSIALGRTGSATQWYLPGTDISRLPSPPRGGAAPPVPGALEETVHDLDGGGTLLGGLVSATGSPDADGPGLVLDVLGAWNSVKNVSFLSEDAERVTLSGFVHADVALGNGESSVTLIGAKRGNVLTGNGGDSVTVEVASNAFGWVNEFRVATGHGDDAVVVRALDVARAAETDPTFAATAGGGGAFTGSDGNTRTFVDLGTGDDSFTAPGRGVDSVSGGHGDDTVRAGGGDDVLEGGAGDDLFLFGAGDGRDTILDFRPGADRLRFGLDRAEVEAILDAAVEADGATTLSYGADSVVLVGVLKSQLSAADLL